MGRAKKENFFFKIIDGKYFAYCASFTQTIGFVFDGMIASYGEWFFAIKKTLTNAIKEHLRFIEEIRDDADLFANAHVG